MATSKYALCVKIDKDMFEIFDIFYVEKDTEIDLKYKKAISLGVFAFHKDISNGIQIGSILEKDNFVSDPAKEYIYISKDQNAYMLTCNNIVFSVLVKNKNDLSDEKYQAAFQSEVILIDVSSEDLVGFGDIWDGKKIINMI
jgi:hypothetical protein